MSGCSDVCVDFDDYGAACTQFCASEVVTARKPHRCEECGRPIAVGDRYERTRGKCEGEMFGVKTCLDCVEIRGAFTCYAWVFSQLWEEVREQMFPTWHKVGPYDCLAKLTRESARDLCRVKFAEWLTDNEFVHPSPPATEGT